jgi:hypothetical protein
MLRVDADRRETPYFEDGSGMADSAFGSGTLMSFHSDTPDCCWGHNHIYGGRFNASGEGYRGLLVSELRHRQTEVDFMTSSPAAFLVAYINADPGLEWDAPDPLTLLEAERIELRFRD